MPAEPEEQLAIRLERQATDLEIRKYVEDLRPSLSDKLNGKQSAEAALNYWVKMLAVASEQDKPAVEAKIAQYRSSIDRIMLELEAETAAAIESSIQHQSPAEVIETPTPAAIKAANPEWTCRIDAFIERMSTPEQIITRADIDRVAGYERSTRENLEAGNGTRRAASNYNDVLRMTREQFLSKLVR